MSTFRCDDQGQLWWQDWCWGDDDRARQRMENMALRFEAAKYREERALGEECRQALADYDNHWFGNEDEELRWITEMTA